MLKLSIPIKKLLNIELYNERLFNKPPKTFDPPFKYDHVTLKFRQELRIPFTTLSELYAEMHYSLPQSLIERIYINICSPRTPASLHTSLLTSDVFLNTMYSGGYTQVLLALNKK